MTQETEQDIRLRQMLEERQFEPCRHDFADAILSVSVKTPQKIRFSFLVWLQKIFTECMLPAPAYIVPCLLLLGLIIGFSNLSNPQLDNDYNLTVQISLDDENT